MSPRRTALLAGLGAAVIVLAVLLIWSLLWRSGPAAETSTTPTATTATAEPTFNPSAGDAEASTQTDNERAWRPVVEHFARNFTNTTGGEQKWRDRLAGNRTPPYITDDVATQLRTVDIDNVPEGRYDTYEIVRASAYDVSVKVTYHEGWAMLVNLITDGTNWQVYSYDRWQQ